MTGNSDADGADWANSREQAKTASIKAPAFYRPFGIRTLVTKRKLSPPSAIIPL